eukprot:COSAG06_NODE_229_length_19707_cov_10.537230_7_plen_124_part_00
MSSNGSAAFTRRARGRRCRVGGKEMRETPVFNQYDSVIASFGRPQPLATYCHRTLLAAPKLPIRVPHAPRWATDRLGYAPVARARSGHHARSPMRVSGGLQLQNIPAAPARWAAELEPAEYVT